MPGKKPKSFLRPSRAAVAFVAAVTVIAGGAALYFVLGPRRARPNVILISIDSLRHDHLGCYGYGPGTSPNIDQVAREGTLFETVVSSTSWTLPAHAALFTGLPDRVHGCSDDLRWLDGSRLTLAEVLRSAGYETVGFFSGPYLSPSFGFAQGFKSYHDCTSYSDKSIALIKAGNLMSKVGQLDQDLMHLAHGDVTNPIVLREVLAWLDARPRGPFLLFIHLWDVHYDYIPPPPYDTMFDPGYKGPVDGRKLLAASRKPEGWTEADVEHLKALYDGEIRWTDDTLGKILGGIERRGLKDSSILAITADHGEAFYEHGLFGHRWTLHEEEIRIPLILRYPAAIRAGARIQRPVRIIDIAPTLLELAGAPPLPDAMGRSLAPLLGNSTAPWSDLPSLCELTVPASKIHNFAVRETALKVILNFAVNKLTVFDLLTDPKEQSPLPEGQAPLSTAALLDLYKSWARKMQDVFERLPVAGERDTPPISKMTEEQLRSLGYLK